MSKNVLNLPARAAAWHKKSILEIGFYRLSLNPQLRHFTYPSPNFTTVKNCANVYQMIDNSAADCPISVKFDTNFEYVTPDVLCIVHDYMIQGKMSKVKVTA